MTIVQERSEAAKQSRNVPHVDMKLEAVVIPVSDADRAKRFYGNLGWRLDADFVVGDAFRVVQFTRTARRAKSCSYEFAPPPPSFLKRVKPRSASCPRSTTIREPPRRRSNTSLG
jgi:hypothetical protein